MPRSRFSSCLSLFVTAGVLGFLWAPLFHLYGASLWDVFKTQPARFWEAFPIATLPRVLFVNTLLLSVSTAVLALILGSVIAPILARRSRWQIPAIVLCAMPLAIAPTLMATAFLAWTRLPPARAAASLAASHTLSINSIFIAAPVLALCFYPIAAFALAAARRAIPSEIEDAARLFGSPFETARRVLWPLLSPAAFAAAGLIATLSMWEMGAPDLLDVRTYSVQIYRDFSAQQDIPKAALDAIPMIFLGALCFWPLWRAFGFYHSWENTGSGASKTAGRGERALIFPASLIFLASPLTAIVIFISQMQPPHILFEVWDVNREEIFNTLIAASLTTILILAVGVVLVGMWREYSRSSQRALAALFVLPIFFAPIMLAIALLDFYNRPIFDWFFNARGDFPTGDWIERYGLLVIGFGCRFLPMGVLWLYESLRRIPKSYEEAAAGLGASRPQIFSAILIPLWLPSLFGLGAVLWALCATELSLAVLLNSPGGQTLPVPIFNQMHIGATEQVAALSLTLIALSVGVLSPALIFLRLKDTLRNKAGAEL